MQKNPPQTPKTTPKTSSSSSFWNYLKINFYYSSHFRTILSLSLARGRYLLARAPGGVRERFWCRSSLLIWPEGFFAAKHKALGNTLIWFELLRSANSCIFSQKTKGLVWNGRTERFPPLSFHNALPANKTPKIYVFLFLLILPQHCLFLN